MEVVLQHTDQGCNNTASPVFYRISTKLDITHNARAIPVQDKKNRSCTATDVPGVAALYHQKTTQPDYHPMMARQSEDQKRI